MKTYSIEFTSRAERQLLRLELQIRRRLLDRIRLLSEWPAEELDVRPLRGQLEGMYRLRVGRYRVIFAIDHSRRIISVREVGHRGSVYR